MENLIRELRENAAVLDGDLPHLMIRAADKISNQAFEIERLRELAFAGGDDKPVEGFIHQATLLAKALGECIEVAGITRPGTDLTGPDLLMFAEDLKHHITASAKQTQDAAENARELITKSLGFEFSPGELQTVNGDDLLRLVEAASSMQVAFG